MGTQVRSVYVGGTALTTALGDTVSEHLTKIESQQVAPSKYNNTPLYSINRDLIKQLGPDYSEIEKLAIHTIDKALGDTDLDLNSSRLAVILSTTKGNIDKIHSDFEKSHLWHTANTLKQHYGLYHTPKIVSSACISGVAALVYAQRMIANSDYDQVIVVGVDMLSDFVVSGFNSFKSISPTLCRPYDLERDGLTLGEGCGVMIFTHNAEASESGIQLLGGGIACDANHISGPSRTGDGLYFAIAEAMRQAQITEDEIAYVNLHGTATPFNDEMESKAMQWAKLQHVPTNSLKPYLGHTLGASGVIETVLVVEQMKAHRVYGVKGFNQIGVPFELNVESSHRDIDIKYALKTASGFGGTNAAIVLGYTKGNEAAVASSVVDTTSLAKVHLQSEEGLNFSEFIRSEFKSLGEANLKFYKMDNLAKLGYVASCKLMDGQNLEIAPERIGLVLANRSSSLDTDLKHQAIVDQNLEEGASPAVFVYTLANVVAAEIAIKHKIKGEVIFWISEEKPMEELTNVAHDLINRDICDAVIYGWCELLGEDFEVELELLLPR